MLMTGCGGVPPEELNRAKQEVTELQTKLEIQRKEHRKEIDGIVERSEDKDAQIKALKDALEAIEAELETQRKEFEEYRQKFRTEARAKAPGKRLPSLVVGGGKTFNKIEIRKVTPVDISFLHEGGIATVMLDDLHPDVRDQFGYHAEEAAQYLAESKSSEKLDLRAVEAIAAAASEEESKLLAAEQAREAEGKQIDSKRRALRAWITALNGQIAEKDRYVRYCRNMHWRARAMGRTSGWPAKATVAERERDELVAKQARCQAALAALPY